MSGFGWLWVGGAEPPTVKDVASRLSGVCEGIDVLSPEKRSLQPAYAQLRMCRATPEVAFPLRRGLGPMVQPQPKLTWTPTATPRLASRTLRPRLKLNPTAPIPQVAFVSLKISCTSAHFSSTSAPGMSDENSFNWSKAAFAIDGFRAEKQPIVTNETRRPCNPKAVG